MSEIPMIRAVAIDDDAPALRAITRFCTEVPYLRLERAFQKPAEALKWIGEHPVDLVFMDMHMPSRTGIDLYKALSPGTLVIFTTTYSDYVVEGFSFSAVDYLQKPFTFDRFVQATAKAREYMAVCVPREDATPEALVLRADSGQVPVPLSEILFIEESDDYVRIHLSAKKPLVVRATLKRMMSRLPPQGFLRVHRSFIVPLARIEKVRDNVISVGGREIPVGAPYERAFFEHFGH
ncbi:MAG TPA: LytTR family DNA-binding domain-containing protein [Dinghuibacter sp.]|uniref:LytR/AlgR family response regulator transcription factor n=1 Tax=Dinghuibacter sp. TaxID=2024697 RepID=UPI002BD56071|nr:LytTR family DNA-binding domain-containing protein [Dinghuibacter sp.]HTJ10527.1 LytTR family DNA-binding domain-containing protein [Dinghuibacter sp.]